MKYIYIIEFGGNKVKNEKCHFYKVTEFQKLRPTVHISDN